MDRIEFLPIGLKAKMEGVLEKKDDLPYEGDGVLTRTRLVLQTTEDVCEAENSGLQTLSCNGQNPATE